MIKIETRFLVAVGDLHCGSSVALCPPNMPLDDGGQYKLSPIQQALWAQWELFWREFVPAVTGGEPFSVLANGDLTEGKHHRSVQTISDHEGAHVGAAIRVLQPVRDQAEQLWIVRGTEAHVGPSAGHEEAIATAIEADGNGQTSSHWETWMEFGPHIIHACHHVGTTSSTAYELSALSRELVANLGEAAQWGNRPADLLIRSHRHRFAYGGFPTSRGVTELVVLPAWQLRTAFAFKKVSMRLPQIGGVVFGYDQWGIFKREFIWVPPRDGEIPLTFEAAKQQRSTGTSSRPASAKRPTTKGRRSRKSPSKRA